MSTINTAASPALLCVPAGSKNVRRSRIRANLWKYRRLTVSETFIIRRRRFALFIFHDIWRDSAFVKKIMIVKNRGKKKTTCTFDRETTRVDYCCQRVQFDYFLQKQTPSTIYYTYTRVYLYLYEFRIYSRNSAIRWFLLASYLHRLFARNNKWRTLESYTQLHIY